MTSQRAEQQMDHSTTHTPCPIPTLTSPSSLAASEATTSSSPTALPNPPTPYPLTLFLLPRLLSLTSLSPFRLPCCSSTCFLTLHFLFVSPLKNPSLSFSPTFVNQPLSAPQLSLTLSLPYLLLPNPSPALSASSPLSLSSPLPAPSVSFYHSGQLT